MLPRLQAEERLNAITDGGVAAGTMERREQTDVLARSGRRRDRAAEAGEGERGGSPTMGIAVRGPAEPPQRGGERWLRNSAKPSSS
jgi:hypothetical protein